jgi:hypothetical protein
MGTQVPEPPPVHAKWSTLHARVAVQSAAVEHVLPLFELELQILEMLQSAPVVQLPVLPVVHVPACAPHCPELVQATPVLEQTPDLAQAASLGPLV